MQAASGGSQISIITNAVLNLGPEINKPTRDEQGQGEKADCFLISVYMHLMSESQHNFRKTSRIALLLRNQNLVHVFPSKRYRMFGVTSSLKVMINKTKMLCNFL